MKQYSLYLMMAASIVMIGITLSTHAQNTSPYWSLAGNNNATSSSKLGTTNSASLRLTTNNTTRLYINGSNGYVGIGTGNSASSSYKLSVNSSNSGIYGSGSTNYGVYGQGGIYGVYGTGNSYGVYGTGVNYGVYGNSSSGYGLRGVSTSSYGIYASSTNGYGGYITSTNSDGLDAYTSAGYFGVWAVSGNSSGYGVYGSGGSYGVYGYSSGGNGVYGSTSNGWAGYFNGNVYSTGGYYPSDRRLKRNIEAVSNAMSIINKLQPKHYEFKNDAQYAALNLPKGTHYGLIAQDLEQVLPNLVREHKANLSPISPLMLKSADGKDANLNQQAVAVKTESMDVKAVNYEELIPIMIAAMQEQNAKIEALTQQVNALTASKQSGISNVSSAIKLSNSYLGQSTPNPAAGTTSIQYNNLPAGARAQLFIADANGKMIKQVQLGSNNGTVNLDLSSLSAGNYTYSLLIDGRLVESKNMQVTR